MKIFTILALSSSLALSATSFALAQDQMAPQPDPNATQNPAVKSPKDMTQAPLAQGKNSFTKAEARARIQAAGYSNVHHLVLDSNGLWQAKALQAGESVSVALDYKGNVASQ